MAKLAMGALPSQRILNLGGSAVKNMSESNVAPASLDLRISDEVYEIRNTILPSAGEKVRDLLPLMQARRQSVSEPLYAKSKYIFRLKEELNLPSEYYGYFNPKSSTGRIDVHVRVLADGMTSYDYVEKGFKGELWLLVEPKSFGIQVEEGYSLTQIRIFNADTRFSKMDLIEHFEKEKLLWHPNENRSFKYDEMHKTHNDGSVTLTLQVPYEGLVGYRCIAPSEQVLKLTDRNVDPRDYFVPVYSSKGLAHFETFEFYILSSAELLRIPPEFAAEMKPTDSRFGEYRCQYAGFGDPGYGYGKNGKSTGRPLTLEMRTYENLVARSNQPIARMVYECMAETPHIQYDGLSSSSYKKQYGPKLAKQFAPYRL